MSEEALAEMFDGALHAVAKTVEKADACTGHATWAITWATYLQSSFDQGDASFRAIMKGATPVASFSGAAGTATVWKLRSAR